MDNKDDEMICFKCKVKLEMSKAHFQYLGHSLHTDMLKCPKCGQVFIPEETVKGRMAEVEMQLEDK